MQQPYLNREEAGRVLAQALRQYAGRQDVVVLALPRGGVPVGYEVAKALGAPLDVFIVRKLGVPGHEELAMGAVASGDVVVLNEDVLSALGLDEDDVARAASREGREVRRRELAYRGDRPPTELQDRIVIVVDDGLATGSTMRAAIRGLRKLGPKRLVMAVPIAAPSTCEALQQEADEVVCARTPEPFRSVGEWYDDFAQTSDDEVRALLARAAGRAEESGRGAPGSKRELTIAVDRVRLGANLLLPDEALGLVVFAHGSGSSRHSPRNRFVAERLVQSGLAALLFDLLTPGEEQAERFTRELRFDIALLSRRLIGVIDRLAESPLGALPIGCFGASTGAAAALIAAAERPARVRAVVSRGGRPDLAGEALDQVLAPVLLIVGGDDEQVIELNEKARARLRHCELRIIPGATHLFEEPGALEAVADLAADFFQRHLGAALPEEAAPGAPPR
jgi:putative phosphoribosyl transferase